ncbi:hydrogenase subunit CooU [Desulfuromonas versatilis]|uniref:Hydrogenase subunit CooU n=1 Tax=Desulfuromonas versatilis TaxID=2802975 RepID=A0ABN6DTU4_9BACT|nr:NADH-quinone oxidoreductase subunit C [Desulfuromonas versatilis]BCR03157.1 hydrogenase subunit CooU [Desulfuromonas versatilis]
MQDLNVQVNEALERALSASLAIDWKSDHKGVKTGWCRLPESAQLLPAAEALSRLGGRLSTVTAYLAQRYRAEGRREIAYHFDLDGTTLTLTIDLPLEKAQVPSLTPLFRNADWNEREFMELYDIEVIGHPNPRRLFLDESIEPAVFDRLIPYSTLTNGAGSQTLWEAVMARSGKEKSE